MGGVDDGIDLRVGQPSPHPVGATEPADADLADRQRGIGHPARQRADHVDGGMQSRGEQSRLCRAAEEQHTHQWCSRRALPDEYR